MADINIVRYIEGSQAIGKSKEEIFQALIAAGFSVDHITEAFGAVGTPAVEPSVSPASSPTSSPAPLLGEQEVGKASVAETAGEGHRAIRFTVVIGALLIGAGIFSWIASNWSDMSPFARILLVVGVMLASYGAGYALTKKGYNKTGGALHLLGAITYGASIFVVAQTFHIRAQWPDGFILWFLGTVAVGFAVNVRSIHVLSILLAIVALWGYPLEIFFNILLLDGSRFVMTSSLFLFAGAIFAIGAGIIFKQRIPEALRGRF